MRFYLISDNIDTYVGMRLVGIEGVVVHDKKEVREALTGSRDDKFICVILMSE